MKSLRHFFSFFYPKNTKLEITLARRAFNLWYPSHPLSKMALILKVDTSDAATGRPSGVSSSVNCSPWRI